MAGIGFELRQLSREDNLIAPLAAFGHASVVAAGPWMFTIIAMALIGNLVHLGVSKMDIATFRVIIIYAFSLSLVVTSPIVIVATRLLSDKLYLREVEDIPALVWSTSALSMAVTSLAALILFASVAGSPFPIVVAGIIASTLVSGIWAALLFCGAVRDYTGISMGFVAGLAVAMLGCVTASLAGGGAVEMTWGFCCGLTLIFFWLLSRVLVTFPHPTRSLWSAVHRHLTAVRRYALLATGAFATAMAIWIDKWIIWCSDLSESVGGGLVHAPVYDSPMFIAYLTIIPSLAIFVTTLETSFFERISGFYRAIEQHATLNQIRTGAAAIERVTISALSRIMLLQATMCLLAVGLAPVIVQALDLQFKQVSVLRFGAVGAMFQLLFLVCSTLLLFFNRHAHFAALQILFLVLQGGLAFLTVMHGETYLGTGYLIATVVCALLSVIALERTMKDIDYLTFSGAAALAAEG